MAILYYLPYIAFRSVNKDKQLLKIAIKNRECAMKEAENKETDVAELKRDVAELKKDVAYIKKDAAKEQGETTVATTNSAQKIVSVHLRRDKTEMTKRVLLNIIIKSLYIFSNLLTFLWLNDVLNYKFIEYGSKSMMWSRLNNTARYRNVGSLGRRLHKPGRVYLRFLAFMLI